MLQRSMPVQPFFGIVGVMSLISLLDVPTGLAYETRPMVGLDLVQDRSVEVMESMRADMSINFMEAALAQATLASGTGDGDDKRSSGEASRGESAVFPSYTFADVDGVLHTCTVRERMEQAESPGKKSTNTDVSTALDPLEGSCATLSHGYWSYKWCHRRDVTQFHKSEDGATTTVVNLGTHTRTELKRVNVTPTKTDAATADSSDSPHETEVSRALNNKKSKGGNNGGRHESQNDDLFHGINDVSELAAVYDYYEGGDVCEETGARRLLKTTISCCTANNVSAGGDSADPLAILVSLQEVSTCSYLVQVCSRLLCPAATDGLTLGLGQEAVVSSGVVVEGKVGGVLGLLQELEACFPPKKEAWWAYKLCISTTGFSQYHEDLFRKADGSLTSKVTTEFSLGMWDKSKVTGEGEELIRPRQQEEGEGGTIILEFTGGTECDLTGVLRSTTVHLKCGSVQEVREVTEDHTCHYRVLAISPLLCSHPALRPKKAVVRTVDCVAEGNTQGKTSKKNRKHVLSSVRSPSD
ncbi:unnamed protein product [Ectocarpus sp. 4 AP-2014]